MVEHSITEILKQLLVDESAAGAAMTDDWPCYQGVLPDKPDNAIAIYETAPIKEGRLMNGEVLDRPGFQIVIRGRTTVEAYDRMDLVVSKVDAVLNTVVDVKETRTYTLHNLVRSGLPLHLPETVGKRRTFFTLNGTAALTEALLNAVLFQNGDVAAFQDGDEIIWQNSGDLPDA